MTNILPIDQFKGDLERQKTIIKEVLPVHMPVERFIRSAVVAATHNPDILTADKPSLFASLMKCAIDGLIPDGREAALIIFNTKTKAGNWVKRAQYMPMVDGVLKRARQSGEISSITARCVYESDTFRYWVDEDGEHLSHEPNLLGDRGEMKLVYAMARLKSGEILVEPMSMADVHRVRLASKSPDRGPWKDWFDRMALKSVLHRLARRLPNSSEIMDMLDAGNVLYDFKQDRDVTPKRNTSIARKLECIDDVAMHDDVVEPIPAADLVAELHTLSSDHDLAEWVAKVSMYDSESEELKDLRAKYREHKANLQHAQNAE